MDQFDLNLSTRPFKPYRAANFGLLALFLSLLAVSAQQILSYQQSSSRAAESREIEQEVRADTDQLGSEVQKLNEKMASGNATVKLSEVEQLNQILIRKSFSWTTVFANLEKLMPDDVRLLGLRPFVGETGRIGLTMDIRGRSLNDATEFLRTLEDSEIFTEVTLAVQEKKDTSTAGEVEFALSAFYVPPESKPPNKAETKPHSKPQAKAQQSKVVQ